jgi:hypothetical protein
MGAAEHCKENLCVTVKYGVFRRDGAGERFFVGLAFELRTSPLQSRCSTAGTTPPVHFWSHYFGESLELFPWVSLEPSVLLILAPK